MVSVAYLSPSGCSARGLQACPQWLGLMAWSPSRRPTACLGGSARGDSAYSSSGSFWTQFLSQHFSLCVQRILGKLLIASENWLDFVSGYRENISVPYFKNPAHWSIPFRAPSLQPQRLLLSPTCWQPQRLNLVNLAEWGRTSSSCSCLGKSHRMRPSQHK